MDIYNSIPNGRYWLCPLSYLEFYPIKVEFSEGIWLVPMPFEFERYLRNRFVDWLWLWSEPSHADCLAILPYGENKQHVSALLIDLITAFRLCHEGMVAPGPLVAVELQNSVFSRFESEDELPGIETGPILTSLSEDVDPFMPWEDEYELEEEDVVQTNDLLKELIKLRGKTEPNNLGIALRRFNSSYHGYLGDRLIDQMIAFESLYLGKEQELKYKLSLRVAFLLGEDEGDRKDIFNSIGKAYKLRSEIIHGSRQLERHELEETIFEAEEYLRQSIRKFISFLSQGKSLKNIRNSLDENILKSGKFLTS